MAIVRRKEIPSERDVDATNSYEATIAKIEASGLYYFPLPIREIIENIYRITIIDDQDTDKDISGYLEFSSANGWIIGVNRYHSQRRQRFTLAHELAHFVLHRNTILQQKARHEDGILLRTGDFSDIESEANDFAGKLIMPKDQLIKVIQGGKRSIDELAETFDVSIAAIRYRAHQLGLLRRV